VVEGNKKLLFEEVLSDLNTYGSERMTVESIRDANNGRPDGRLVTNENLHLFRQYRNTVSPAPGHLVQAARNYHNMKGSV